MKAPFAAWRVLARPVAVPEGVRGTASGTMAGGRDKRRGTSAHYTVVFTGDFACRRLIGSAASWPNRLILFTFHRAVARSESTAL